jgi:hypothetical protein
MAPGPISYVLNRNTSSLSPMPKFLFSLKRSPFLAAPVMRPHADEKDRVIPLAHTSELFRFKSFPICPRPFAMWWMARPDDD